MLIIIIDGCLITVKATMACKRLTDMYIQIAKEMEYLAENKIVTLQHETACKKLSFLSISVQHFHVKAAQTYTTVHSFQFFYHRIDTRFIITIMRI